MKDEDYAFEQRRQAQYRRRELDQLAPVAPEGRHGDPLQPHGGSRP